MFQKAILFLLILTISFIGTPLSAQIVEDGLVSYWSFDGKQYRRKDR